MNNSKVTFYVVTHKPISYKYTKDYHIINVTKNMDPRGIKYDEKVNIKEKNPTFCELTALYWIWKNDSESKYIGLEHYRRIFTINFLSNNKNFFLKANRVVKILKKYDILTTKLYSFNKTIFDNRLEFCYKKDMLLLGETIKEVCPDYLNTYLEVINNHRSFLCNMFITNKDILDKYCTWLFTLLFALEKKIDTSSYEGNFKRIYGYMGEILLTVFIFQNKLKYKECYVASLERPVIKKVIGFLKRKGRQ